MRRTLIILCATAGLGACGKSMSAPAASDATAAPAAPAASEATTSSAAPAKTAAEAEAFNLVGTEPFWAMEVRPGALRFSRPDAADITHDNPGVRWAGKSRSWTTPGMIATITPGTCSDGMSDRRYDYVAEVRLGEQTFKGCASRAGPPT